MCGVYQLRTLYCLFIVSSKVLASPDARPIHPTSNGCTMRPEFRLPSQSGHSTVGASVTSMWCASCSQLLSNSQHSLRPRCGTLMPECNGLSQFRKYRQTLHTCPRTGSHSIPTRPTVPKKLPSRPGFELRPARVLSPSAQQALWPIISGLAH